MTYEELLDHAAHLPVIETELLRVLGEDPLSLSVQISRWVRGGKLIQLRRGLYLLPERSRLRPASVDYLANLIATPSYVSLERALSIHGLIPESVPLVQSVTTGRTRTLETPLSTFVYRHVKRPWFTGYQEMQVGESRALVATPDKAFLDLVYLSSGEFTRARISELRLQDLERFDPEALMRLAGLVASARLERAARNLVEHIEEEA
jgi:predicted transcriptional regulator of viral defense system